MTTPTHAITIRQPWLWAIMHGGKFIENRTWATSYRGPIYLHAAQNLADASATAKFSALLRAHDMNPPDFDSLPRGALLATARLVDVVRNGDSVWADLDCYHFVLADVVVLDEPIVTRGALGLWPVRGRQRSERLAAPGKHSGSCG